MAKFTFKARNKIGDLVNGEVEADNTKSAKTKIADQGLLPISVESKGMDFQMPAFFSSGNKVAPKDLMAFTRQFAALFKGGVPINRLLTALTKQTANPKMQKVISAIRQDISSGSSLTDAFGKHPEVFSDLYINMVNVGEQAGVLEQTLQELSSVLEKDLRIVAKVKSATLYPKVVLVIFSGVVVLMMVYVVPRFADFFGGFGATLPLPTRIMMGMSNFVINYWYVVAGVITAGILAFKKYAKSEKGKFKIDQFKFKTPVFGGLNQLIANARFGHLVGALYKSGLQLAKALTISAKAIGNTAYQKEVEDVNEDVKRGSTLAAAMEKRKYFTPMIIEAVAVGEQSGTLDEMLETTSQFYDEEVAGMLDQLTTLIEPIMILGLFGMVSLLAFAIFLPMWNVSTVVLQNQ